MKKRFIFGLFFASSATLLTVALTGCDKTSKSVFSRLKEPKLVSGTDYLTVKTSIGYRSLQQFADPEMSNATIELGRVLFYDTRLSINDRVSCGSCHQQNLGFADQLPFSNGFGDRLTARNSSAIINTFEKQGLFWDIRAKNTLELSLMPVFNHIEMGMESDEMMIKKISSAAFYRPMFIKAFGQAVPTRQLISKAISHFVNALFSEDSKFDQGESVNFENLTTLEKMGKDIFQGNRGNCAHCHGIGSLNQPSSSRYGQPLDNTNTKNPENTANIGLDLKYTDQGFNDGRFRIPSLRNIALTAPYMHDGRFKTLEEVVDHYSKGIKDHPNLDPLFKTAAGPVRFNFTETEKIALVAFLKTLTDRSLTTQKRYSDPFLP